MQADPVPEVAVISSASSKTAIAAAHSLQRRGVKTIGLTSARNVDFVKATNLYDEVLTYETADQCGGGGGIEGMRAGM